MSGAKPVFEAPKADTALDFQIIELLFFAYRDFVGDADELLSGYQFGRAHHRVLHFVSRRPGLSVAELLDILKITKQSLGPVLKDLVKSGHLVQIAAPDDRRKRLLYPSEAGRELSLKLTDLQSRRIKRALTGLDDDGRKLIEGFLFQMIEPREHSLVASLTGGGTVKQIESKTVSGAG